MLLGLFMQEIGQFVFLVGIIPQILILKSLAVLLVKI